MTTSEDQTQAIVRDFFGIVFGFRDGANQTGLRIPGKLFVESGAAPEAVDGFMLRRLNDPGSRKFRNTVSRPSIDGGNKSFLGVIFSHLQVAEVPTECSHDPAALRGLH